MAEGLEHCVPNAALSDGLLHCAIEASWYAACMFWMWFTHTKPRDCILPYIFCAGLVHVINKFRVKTLGLVPVRLGNKGPHLLAAHQVCIDPCSPLHVAIHTAARAMCHQCYACGCTSLKHPCCQLRKVQFSVNAGSWEMNVHVSLSYSLCTPFPLWATPLPAPRGFLTEAFGSAPALPLTVYVMDTRQHAIRTLLILEMPQQSSCDARLCPMLGALCILLERSTCTKTSGLGRPHRCGRLLLSERGKPHEVRTSQGAEGVSGGGKAPGVHRLWQPHGG